MIRIEGAFSKCTNEGMLKSKLSLFLMASIRELQGLLGIKPIKYPRDIAWSLEAEIEAPGIARTGYVRVLCR